MRKGFAIVERGGRKTEKKGFKRGVSFKSDDAGSELELAHNFLRKKGPTRKGLTNTGKGGMPPNPQFVPGGKE